MLAQEAERARAAGQPELAATIDQQIDKIRRQVAYHLAQARAAAAGANPAIRCSVVASVEGLVRTLHRLHAGRRVQIEASRIDLSAWMLAVAGLGDSRLLPAGWGTPLTPF